MFDYVLKSISQTLLIFICTAFISTQSWSWSFLPDRFHGLSSNENILELIRKNFQLADNTDEPAVQKEINWYKHHKRTFYKILNEARPYLYYVYHEIHGRGIPSEVALIPIIESAYNPFRYSHAGAAGLWQIMPSTASGLGLQIDWWYDGRRDVTASTKAALDYFSYLNHFFDGDWLLSIAAYDSGEGKVQHAIEANTRENKDIDFWSLPLPKETRRYIPRLLAVVEILRHPSDYEIELPYIPNKPYFSEVKVGYQMDLSAAAKLAEVPLTELYLLNPGYNRWATAPNGPYHLLLPVEKVNDFKSNLGHLAQQPSISWQKHRIRKGDTLSSLAKKYHTTDKVIHTINRLKSSTLTINQVLLIPIQPQHSNNQIVQLRRNAVLASQLKQLKSHKKTHRKS